MLRRFALLAVLWVAACTNANDLDRAGVSLGDFSLCYNIVVAPNIVKAPGSREATVEQWQAGMTSAIDERFGRYRETGTKHYHIAVSVEGYMLAPPGVPLVLSPKSALIFNVTVWDDAARKKLNEKPEQLTVLESASGETLLGSGLTQSAEEQLRNLSRNAAKEIQVWMRQKMATDGWFGGTQNSVAGPTAASTSATAANAALPECVLPASTGAQPVAAATPAAPATSPAPATAAPAAASVPVAKPAPVAAPVAAPPAPAPRIVIPDETIIEPDVVPPPRLPATQG